MTKTAAVFPRLRRVVGGALAMTLAFALGLTVARQTPARVALGMYGDSRMTPAEPSEALLSAIGRIFLASTAVQIAWAAATIPFVVTGLEPAILRLTD
jgi:hypothetical protein